MCGKKWCIIFEVQTPIALLNLCTCMWLISAEFFLEVIKKKSTAHSPDALALPAW